MCLGTSLEGILIVGQLHIRVPNGHSTPSISTKKRLVQEAMTILENASDKCKVQPIVAVLCGDVNLSAESADACCQAETGEPSVHTLWHTQASIHGRSGDVAFI